MDFLYDESGNAYSFVYNGTQYYYVRNLQGDVVKILNTSGGVEQIGQNAFFGCTALGEIRLSDSLSAVYTGAFSGGASKITASHAHPRFLTVDGNLYTKDGKTLLQYAAGRKDTAFTCPDTVTAVSACAFRNCTSLADVNRKREQHFKIVLLSLCFFR